MKLNFFKLVFFLCVLSIPQQALSSNKVLLSSYASPGHDVTDILQQLINKYDEIVIDCGTWIVSKPVYLRSNVIIRGINKNKCIIQASESTILKGNTHFTIFSTVKVNHSLGIVRCYSLEEKDYVKDVVKNVVIENLTFDLNKHPETFEKVHKSLLNAEVCALWFENCADCTINNCRFIDWANPERGSSHYLNNGLAAIYIVKGCNCIVRSCSSRKCTFLAILDSNNCIIEGNKGVRSIGTWIETVGGRRHSIIRNYLSNVDWKVSSIGINSKSCEIGYNVVDNNIGGETSVLTLGHDIKDTRAQGYYDMTTSADSSYIHNNKFITKGHRGILVMNASNLNISRNLISVHRVEGISENTEAIVLAGTIDNFNNQMILNNTIVVDGNGTGFGIHGYYLDNSIISGNVIKGNCEFAIDIHTRTTAICITNNIIYNKGKYVIMARDVDDIKIENNKFRGGAINITCENIEFKNNSWKDVNDVSIIEFKKTDISTTRDIINNRFSTVSIFPYNRLFNIKADNNKLNNYNNKITSEHINLK